MVWKPTPPVNDRDAAEFLLHSRLFRVLLSFACLISAFGGVTTYMAFDTTPPYEFIGSESLVVPPSAYGGDQITVKWKVKFNRVCTGSMRRILFDPDTNVVLAVYDTEPVAGIYALEDGYLNKTFRLPTVIQKGWIGYRAELHYRCNFLQRFFPLNVTTPDLHFKIE
jgi:hypothetical protein